ncbi:MAG: VPLPA-CTERM sorting domain-containing protein, partial [Pseudomonadota bacterium]
FSTTDGLGALFASDAFTPLGTDTFASGGGIVDFSLFSNTKNSDPNKEVKNGANPDNSSDTEANFYAWITKGGATSGETVFLFFDDGGAGPDDNHDDFVVSLSVGGGGNNPPPSPVPLPAGGLLMLGGLGAFAIARRRKNKS